MHSPQDEIARHVAAKLAKTTDPNLPQLVEGVLADPETKNSAQMFDAAIAIGLASLLVSIASFAWTVYMDLKKSTPKPDKAILARKTRLKFHTSEGIDEATRELLIDAVVEETIEYERQ
jgi:hypothetical protein